MPVTCNLCLKSVDKFADSHIIAQSIHALSTRVSDPHKAKVISNDPKEYPKKSPTGIYDQIVCASCERIFNVWEDYALEFFRKVYDFISSTQNVQTRNIQMDNFDYAKLKLFFISVLWKASISHKPTYEKVKVGEKHNESLRQMLLKADPGGQQEYAVYLERFNTNRPAASIMRSPLKSRMNDINFYTFYMAFFKIHIKCDSRNIPKESLPYFLTNKNPLIIFLFPFENSREHTEYTKVIKLPHNFNAF